MDLLLAIVEILAGVFVGWRYLLCPEYRKKVHRMWRQVSWWAVLVDVYRAILMTLVSLALVLGVLGNLPGGCALRCAGLG